ncbi:YceI family protein [Mariniflexile litorale]|uniref:YceI family protein n=1 Tax=Mariniflexile litorale TaxID=3045158 RepID=A0AAU7EIK0_9FLAO|nr:YceI family protein [Mariniflexile sp. KMM 9835]MDQ8210715.1 YceI family protein [Mariniflexile sp. KMM 9835]
MIIKKVLFLISILTTIAFTTRDSIIKSTSVIITPQSSLKVKGTTNVSDFSCVFNINKFKNPIQVFYHVENGKIVFNKTALVLENDCFDCGGRAINNDFQKILKSDKYPQITLFLKEINQTENMRDVQASINIEIAGVTQDYKIPVKVKKSNDLFISGDLVIRLSDYNLETPKKLFGLISINDIIKIDFQLLIREK